MEKLERTPNYHPLPLTSGVVYTTLQNEQVQIYLPMDPQPSTEESIEVPLEGFVHCSPGGVVSGRSMRLIWDYSGPGEEEYWISFPIKSPYIPGDYFWIQEKFAYVNATDPVLSNDKVNRIYNYGLACIYGLDREVIGYDEEWLPNILMLRWASRLTTEIIEVKAEQIQNITLQSINAGGISCDNCWTKKEPYEFLPQEEWQCGCLEKYINNWNDLYSMRGLSWEENPWCWHITMQRVK